MAAEYTIHIFTKYNYIPLHGSKKLITQIVNSLEIAVGSNKTDRSFQMTNKEYTYLAIRSVDDIVGWTVSQNNSTISKLQERLLRLQVRQQESIAEADGWKDGPENDED